MRGEGCRFHREKACSFFSEEREQAPHGDDHSKDLTIHHNVALYCAANAYAACVIVTIRLLQLAFNPSPSVLGSSWTGFCRGPPRPLNASVCGPALFRVSGLPILLEYTFTDIWKKDKARGPPRGVEGGWPRQWWPGCTYIRRCPFL